MAQKSGAERQAAYAAKLQAEGKRQVYLWLDNNSTVALKRAYPGTRGGIDWQSIITTALSPTDGKSGADVLEMRQEVERLRAEVAQLRAENIALKARMAPSTYEKLLEPETPHQVSDNIEVEFWKHGEGRRICQARNANGERCRNETHGAGIRHRLPDGRIGLFDVCKRHNRADLFQPHPSVLG